MVSMSSILVMVAVVATTIDYVEAHGYMAEPKCTFTRAAKPSEWVVEVKPPWEAPWDKASGDEGLLSTFKTAAAANNFKDIRSLMDGNPLYGADCGYTDPKAKPVDPPSNGRATFSRGILHAGPCEIWLDDKMVFQSDDCQSSCGDGTKETASVFKPVDYSSCAPGGCMFRFYWLALQVLDGTTLWQAYKNCIPLTGPGGGGASQGDTSDSFLQVAPEDFGAGQGSSDSKTEKDSKSEKDSSDSKSDKDSSKTPPAENSPETPPAGNSPETPPAGNSPETPPAGYSPETPPAGNSPSTPEMTPAPSSKCNGRRRRRD